MKRLLISAILTVPLFGAGTCTVVGPTGIGQTQVYTNSQPFLVTFTCTADASNGSFPSTAMPGVIASSQVQGYFITRVEVVPGSPNPTAGYKMTITDANGVDELGGNAGNLSASVAQIFSTGAAVTPINGAEMLNITGNTVNSANVTVLVFLAAGNAIVGGQVSISPNTSAANLSATLNTGAGIVEKGPRWTVMSNVAAGSLANAAKAAGGAGVRHVVDCIAFSGGATTAPVATSLGILLIDNATTVWVYSLGIPASTGQLVGPISFCGLNIVGQVNQAMNIQFSAGLTNMTEAVSMSGYDVN